MHNTNKQSAWGRGAVQVYTGDGKGKTTAALGAALRAAGAGMRVFIGQFVKGMHYSELEVLGRLSGLITVKQYGRRCFIEHGPEPEDIAAAQEGLAEMGRIIAAGEYQMVILDEANIATHFGLFTVDELLAVVEARPVHVELIITGRRADPKLLARADLVTEMREVKHYYSQGVEARKGIEN
jgi:cob(I)alamin adenosyltransferase